MAKRIKKIGLLSTQFTINYGAVLQAYSLFSTLQKSEGVEVTTIDYAPQGARYGHYETYSFQGIKNTVLSILKFINIGYRSSRIQKKASFQFFVTQEFSLTSKTYYTNNELLSADFSFDLAIVGSDQVWNPKVINDPSFYLNFINAQSTVKSSYAASLGDELSPDELTDLVEYISDFTRVSFREPIQVDEVQQKSRKSIDVLVDPVFLTTKNEWLELAKKSELDLSVPFILIYEVNSPPDFKEYVKYIKKHTQLKIIVVSTRPFSKYLGVYTISDAGPYDFLKLFSNAEYVFTSSFHGVSFSSIFNIPFSCVLNVERSTRQRHLLERLKISSCEVRNIDELSTNLNRKYNWNEVDKSIAKLQQTSNIYITELLENVT
jgi:hypothetical protein